MAIHGNTSSEVVAKEETFKESVEKGLTSFPKHLSSKYFYDKKGDELFVKITQLPEYYLTKAENEVINEQRNEILSAFKLDEELVEIIELGAGDGHKAAYLLHPVSAMKNVEFAPVDISQNTLDIVVERFKKEIPEIAVKPMQGDYFSVLSELNDHRRKIVLFLGSNIGNLNEDQSHEFIHQLSNTLSKGDMLLLGVDLKKSKDIILPAYNDSQGITSEFNLNLLDRINRELGGNFNRSGFVHDPEYDEEIGEARSYIKSLKDQEVRLDAIGISVHFDKDERIHTEISQKYDDDRIKKITEGTNLTLVKKFTDSRSYFADYLFEKS